MFKCLNRNHVGITFCRLDFDTCSILFFFFFLWSISLWSLIYLVKFLPYHSQPAAEGTAYPQMFETADCEITRSIANPSVQGEHQQAFSVNIYPLNHESHGEHKRTYIEMGKGCQIYGLFLSWLFFYSCSKYSYSAFENRYIVHPLHVCFTISSTCQSFQAGP